jgi:hypothetical protein
MQAGGLLRVNGYRTIIAGNLGRHDGAIAGHIMHRPVGALSYGHVTDALALNRIRSVVRMRNRRYHVGEAVSALIRHFPFPPFP